MVLGSSKTKGGKVAHTTQPLAAGVGVVSDKRDEKPVAPDRAV
jgi:hypothetical protein